MKNKFIYTIITAATLLLAMQVPAQQRQTVKNNPTRQPSPPKVVDTTLFPKYEAREVVFQVPCEKGATIQINNSTRNLDIRTWAESKVKIATTVNILESESKNITAEKLMEEGGLSLKSFGNRVNIEAKTVHNVYDYYLQSLNGRMTPGSSALQTDGQKYFSDLFVGSQNKLTTTNPEPTTAETELRDILNEQQVLSNKQNDLYHSIITSRNNQVMTIYIPEGCKLDVENKNTNIIINTNIPQATFKMNRSNLDARDFERLTVIGDYCTMNISNVEEADIELENGSLTAGVIKNLDLDTKNSEIDYEGGEYCYLRSQSDRIMIDEVGKIDGRKLYGDLRIGRLRQSIDLEGANADIKIRHLMPEVEKIKLNNKYADLRLPVKQLTNYTVTFHGTNSTVFAPFEKIPTPADPSEIKTVKLTPVNPKTTKTNEKPVVYEEATSPTRLTYIDGEAYLFNSFRSFGEVAPVKFTAAAGSTAGKFTKFEIVCHQCSVDFK